MSDSRLIQEKNKGDALSMLRPLAELQNALASIHQLDEPLRRAASLCADALRRGQKLLVCGNGGSAAEAQHLVGELMGRYRCDRCSLPAIALHADAVTLTCIGNDYSFEEVFSRQFNALRKPGDILIVFSTSGTSKNIVGVLEAAKSSQVSSIGFLGRDGGKAANIVDLALVVLHPDTARIQECHQFLMHCLMDQIELHLT